MINAAPEGTHAPDVEAAAVAFLAVKFPGHQVTTRRPYAADWTTDAAGIVQVSVTGGEPPASLVVDRSRLTISVWEASGPAAAETAGSVFGALQSWRGWHAGALVYGCVPARPVSAPDPLTPHPRYILTASVNTRLGGT